MPQPLCLLEKQGASLEGGGPGEVPGAPVDSKSIRCAQPGVEHVSETLSADRCYRLPQAQPVPGSPPRRGEGRGPLNINQAGGKWVSFQSTRPIPRPLPAAWQETLGA